MAALMTTEKPDNVTTYSAKALSLQLRASNRRGFVIESLRVDRYFISQGRYSADYWSNLRPAPIHIRPRSSVLGLRQYSLRSRFSDTHLRLAESLRYFTCRHWAALVGRVTRWFSP